MIEAESSGFCTDIRENLYGKRGAAIKACAKLIVLQRIASRIFIAKGHGRGMKFTHGFNDFFAVKLRHSDSFER